MRTTRQKRIGTGRQPSNQVLTVDVYNLLERKCYNSTRKTRTLLQVSKQVVDTSMLKSRQQVVFTLLDRSCVVVKKLGAVINLIVPTERS